MRKYLISFLLFLCFLFLTQSVFAQTGRNALSLIPTNEEQEAIESATTEFDSATASSTVIERVTLTPETRTDLTVESPKTVEPLKKLLDEQQLGSPFPSNPVKYAIRGAVAAGVPPNTIVLLLLLPGVAALIAGARHLVGLRGFGIFLPAALSVVFVATGPIVGIGLFLVIVFVSTTARITMRRLKLKLQYLPRMALILHFVVFGILLILFAAPIIRREELASVSIFPVLILVLLAEDFSRVQLGKSARVAINLTTETLILALASYFFLTTKLVQEFALLKPEVWILSILVFDFLMGRYVGLRFLELWRFRKLIKR
ncbi:hypothetical protein A2715_00030 [Candidatus Woesebacteria bacterium RIFCSPHIGHO2_01_FULL_39_32]|uniref:7 transmembrane helices usually fused to an inactive transglutaminase domain-containing protein n=1 Tax=Candidatus Woesebacteria bacterium RIFCSPLOWO2_01_FULL_39_25 TaxID=1802521 RepID=A0A1F8BNA4_9BACT|nr:MAG: hypothetical protein UT00_C0016G0015 [Parcubacteria group bacterium GW2011_GWA1_38_7]OGM03427.1 MAG: hypothetical protein A2124_01755 [Candidatus Woesebacteria bacterium GWB1_37_5]OGM24953.1 MAG: hypothetical protein A2715_00030 [Candidatus Woesebacteria bacterium RIFCSPHIGHO2_01_FULL_39_32]OGM35488.1 MAG: hypothetical protein A3F01_02390 [Candidatus Woesebacteria bacterium RIFCSPHIGHO2_12_FULL_38_11]OGM65581.1 MAG: hypothetical protein A2893_01490 [Candidatus Woesebacteria bacterium RI